MKRGTFLKRVGLVLGGVAVGRHVQFEDVLPTAGPEGVMEVGLIRDSVLHSTNDYQIFAETFTASGGLCAPLSPIYDMPALASPIWDSLPMFTTSRGLPSPE